MNIRGCCIDDEIAAVRIAVALERLIKFGQRLNVRLSQVPDIDIIADAGAVARWPVDAGDGEMVDFSQCGIDELADDMRRFFDVNSASVFRIGADGIEIAERDPFHSVRFAGILQDHFHDEFRPRVRRGRVEVAVFRDDEVRFFAGFEPDVAVDRRRRAEDDPFAAEFMQNMEHLVRLGDVFAVILVRAGDRIGNDDQR